MNTDDLSEKEDLLRTYEPPRLEFFGKIAEITTSGTPGDDDDDDDGKKKKKKKKKRVTRRVYGGGK